MLLYEKEYLKIPLLLGGGGDSMPRCLKKISFFCLDVSQFKISIFRILQSLNKHFPLLSKIELILVLILILLMFVSKTFLLNVKMFT